MNDNEFKWTDELASKWADWYRMAQGQSHFCGKDLLDEWKKTITSKSQGQPIQGKEEQRIEVDNKPDWEILKQGYVGEASYKTIFQVKRLSDGEIFSIGDTIRVYRDSGYKGDRKLLSFYIDKYKVLKIVHDGSESNLYQISKLPPQPQKEALSNSWRNELCSEIKYTPDGSELMYTKLQVDEIKKQAFIAGREENDTSRSWIYKYASYGDYLARTTNTENK